MGEDTAGISPSALYSAFLGTAREQERQRLVLRVLCEEDDWAREAAGVVQEGVDDGGVPVQRPRF